jgi:hypothetical protein
MVRLTEANLSLNVLFFDCVKLKNGTFREIVLGDNVISLIVT